MPTSKLDIRVYPVEEPKGSTLAFASIAVDDLAAIQGLRVVSGRNGNFVSMPQSQDNTGAYHDIAFPLTGGLRKEINAAVLSEYEAQASLHPRQRGYDRPEQGGPAGRDADGIKIDVKVYPLDNPKGDTLAFASVGIDDTVAINGLRVVDGEKGRFVSMPQTKGRDEACHDVAFPLSGDLRKAISNAVLSDYKKQTAERKQSIGDRLADGKAQADQYAANAPERTAAKKAPGLGG